MTDDYNPNIEPYAVFATEADLNKCLREHMDMAWREGRDAAAARMQTYFAPYREIGLGDEAANEIGALKSPYEAAP